VLHFIWRFDKDCPFIGGEPFQGSYPSKGKGCCISDFIPGSGDGIRAVTSTDAFIIEDDASEKSILLIIWPNQHDNVTQSSS